MPSPTSAADLVEVVVLGRHPDHPALEVLVLGGTGEDRLFELACEMATLAIGRRLAFTEGLVIVSLKDDWVRPARTLRRLP
jgi:hypothetical protein